MDDGGHLHLEQQQPPIRPLGAVEHDVIQAKPLMQPAKGFGMANGKAGGEARHGTGLLGALGLILQHAGVDVMDHPMA